MMDHNAGGPFVVTCTLNGVRFFLTEGNTASDILARARQFQDRATAQAVARQERLDRAWNGRFKWHVKRRCAFE
jgi:hypothetical protein